MLQAQHNSESEENYLWFSVFDFFPHVIYITYTLWVSLMYWSLSNVYIYFSIVLKLENVNGVQFTVFTHVFFLNGFFFETYANTLLHMCTWTKKTTFTKEFLQIKNWMTNFLKKNSHNILNIWIWIKKPTWKFYSSILETTPVFSHFFSKSETQKSHFVHYSLGCL